MRGGSRVCLERDTSRAELKINKPNSPGQPVREGGQKDRCVAPSGPINSRSIALESKSFSRSSETLMPFLSRRYATRR